VRSQAHQELTFDQIDGVWVTEPRCAVAVAIALRESSIALSAARIAGEGQQTKMELVYQYMTGPRFRHRIGAVVERFTDMQADLDRERKTMMRLWAKREEQVRGVVEPTGGLYGIAAEAFWKSKCWNCRCLMDPAGVTLGLSQPSETGMTSTRLQAAIRDCHAGGGQPRKM
jgi:hypothetical protein